VSLQARHSLPEQLVAQFVAEQSSQRLSAPHCVEQSVA
jgi:hypothetical protein